MAQRHPVRAAIRLSESEITIASSKPPDLLLQPEQVLHIVRDRGTELRLDRDDALIGAGLGRRQRGGAVSGDDNVKPATA